MTEFLGIDITELPQTHKLCYLGECEFYRDSPAFGSNGEEYLPHQPRFNYRGENGFLIEYEHENILPEEISYALNGSYNLGTPGFKTYSCLAGSFELSGALTGVVTPGNPITATVKSGDVIMTGNSLYNQVSGTPVELSWVPGGTYFEKEVLRAPGSILNMGANTNLTIECEAFVTPQETWNLIFGVETSYDDDLGYFEAYIFEDGLMYADYWYPPDLYRSGIIDFHYGWNKFGFTVDNDEVVIYSNGVEGVTFENPHPLNPENLGICNWYNGYQWNSLMRNFVVSNIKRTPEDMEQRALANSDALGFPADEYCTLIYPLKQNLDAYRVVER